MFQFLFFTGHGPSAYMFGMGVVALLLNLDVNRAPHRDLALGHGIHLCMGRALALIELEVVFGTLFRRIPLAVAASPTFPVRPSGRM